MTEECTLRIFENWVLRRIFRPKKDEVTGEWRILHEKGLYALYSSPNHLGDQLKKSEMGTTCSTYRRQQRCIQGFNEEA